MALLLAVPLAAQTATQLAISGVPGVLYTNGNFGLVTMKVESATGAVVTSSTATIKLALTGPGGYSHSITGAATAGLATFNASAWPLTTTGAYTLKATSGTLTAATATVTVQAGPTGFGSSTSQVNVGSSANETLTFGFTTATTVSSVQVLYEGAPNLDFTDAGDTCVGAQIANGTCTVNVKFAPKAVGRRLGAVELIGANGVVQTQYVSGLGMGAEMNFGATAQTEVGTYTGEPDALTFDGAGNLYVADYPCSNGTLCSATGNIIKIPNINGTLTPTQQSIVASGMAFIDGLAFDGAGNLIISDFIDNQVYEIPAGGGAPLLILDNPLGGPSTSPNEPSNPSNIAVDGAGNIFICDQGNNRIDEIPNQNGVLNPAAAIALGTAVGNTVLLNQPYDVAIDSLGNLIVADWGNSAVEEIPLTNGAYGLTQNIFNTPNANPSAVAFDAAGNLYVTSELGCPTGATCVGLANGVTDATDGGELEVVPYQNGTYNPAQAVVLAGGVPGSLASVALNAPDALLIDPNNNVYIADTYHGLVYAVTTVPPPPLAFPNTGVGALSAAQSDPVISTGNVALSFNGTGTITGPFQNAGGSCPATGTLAVGATCDVNVQFAPTATGAATGGLTLSDNAVNQLLSSQPLNLSGTGIAGTQLITFGAPPTAVYGQTESLGLTAGASGNAVTLNVSGPATLTGSGASASLTFTGIGTVTVTANQAGNSLFSAAPTATLQITVAPAPLTWTGTNEKIVYGGLLPQLSGTVTGVIAGDGITATWSIQNLPAPPALPGVVAGGGWPITATLNDPNHRLANYTVSGTPGSMIVTPAPLVITAASGSMIFGGTIPNLSPSPANYVGLQGTDNYTVVTGQSCTTTATASSTPGTYPSTCSGGSATNYTITYVPGTITVLGAAITITAANTTMTYGGAVPVISFVASLPSLLGVAPTCTTTATSTSPVGVYPATCSGGSLLSLDYALSYVAGTVTVKPAPLTSTGAALSMIYGGTIPAAGGTLGGVLNSDGITATWAIQGLPVPPAIPGVVGSGGYPITATLNDPNHRLANYTVTANPGLLTVKPAPLTITAFSGSMQAGGTVPALPPSYTGFVSPDNPTVVFGLSCTTTATSSSAPGTYPSTCSGGTATNYAITFVAGTINVLGTPTAGLAPAASTVYGSTLAADLVTTNSVPGIWSFAVAGQPTAVSAVLGAGTYTITGVFTPTSANYNPVTVSTSLTVSPAVLTVTAANVTMTAGGSLPALTYTITGFVNGDTSSVVTGTPGETTTATATSPAGTYPITLTLGNLTAANYTFNLATGATVTVSNGIGLDWGLYATSNICQAIQLTGNSTVDSYDSAFGGYPAGLDQVHGSIGTNGNVQLTGNSTVYGTLFDPHGITSGNCGNHGSSIATTSLTANGHANATGGIVTLPAALVFPAPLAPSPLPPSTNENINGACGAIAGCTQQGSNHVALAPGTYGDVTVNGGAQIDLSQGTYNLNTIRLTGNSILNVVSGPVVLNLEGPPGANANDALDFTGGTVQNAINPSMLQVLYAGSNDIELSGGVQTAMIVYAPNAPVTLSGNADLAGTIIGATIKVTGNARIHYDRELAQLPLPVSGGDSPTPLPKPPAVLTVAANSASAVYGTCDGDNDGDDAGCNVTYTISGFVNGDSAATVITGTAAITTNAPENAGVGTYTVTVAQGSLQAKGNYTFQFVSGTLSITPATLTVVGSRLQRAVGHANPALTYTITGFVNGDTSRVVSGNPSLGTSATPASPAGLYPIVVGVGSLKAANYVFAFVNGMLTVYNPRDVNDPHCDGNGNYCANQAWDSQHWSDSSSFNYWCGNQGH